MAGDNEGLDETAMIVERLAVMLSAGISPASAWSHQAEADSERAARSMLGSRRRRAAVVQAVAEGYSRGEQAGATLLALTARLPVAERESWRALAATWEMSAAAGSPLGPALSDLGEELRFSAELAREAHSALASVRASTSLMLALPVLGCS